MPLPLDAVAPLALRRGTGAGTLALAGRAIARAARDRKAGDATDRAPEGVSAWRDAGQCHATARFRRVLRRRAGVPGIGIDIAALGRIRVRKVG